MSYPHHNRCPRHLKHHVPYGFSILSDLVPLFHMADDFRRKPLSPQAKKRLAWFDQYRQSANVALTCRHFGISKTLLLLVEAL